MPKGSEEKGPSALTVPRKATSGRAKAEPEEQVGRCIEADDDPYGVVQQT